MFALSFLSRRVLRIAALVLVGATATCVDQPTAPREPGFSPVPRRIAPPTVATSIAHTLLTSGTSKANQQVCTTESVAPAANALVTVAVMGHNTTDASPSPTVSGGGMSAWTQVATVAFDEKAGPHKRLSIFRAMSPSPGSGPVEITFTTSQANCQWVVAQWRGVETSGTNGSDAIAQAGSARGDDVTGLVVTLGAFADTGNVAYGVFGVHRSTTGVTPGGGFTETSEWTSGETPPSDLQAEFSANDTTINATWAAANAGALGLEIRAAGAAPQPVASVEVSPDSVSVVMGDTVRLAAATQDAGGEPLDRPPGVVDDRRSSGGDGVGQRPRLCGRGGSRYDHGDERREERHGAGHGHGCLGAGGIGRSRARSAHRRRGEQGAAHRDAEGRGRPAAERTHRDLDERRSSRGHGLEHGSRHRGGPGSGGDHRHERGPGGDVERDGHRAVPIGGRGASGRRSNRRPSSSSISTCCRMAEC